MLFLIVSADPLSVELNFSEFSSMRKPFPGLDSHMVNIKPYVFQENARDNFVNLVLLEKNQISTHIR